ncbi:carbohydrate-binding domain-containing protein [Mycobacterium hubeiense]|uniref:carbohydrate-binding domain-containing protein n=1 Tax=Mycobacterium hubeiense TaxID=1867256 RepID=UPI000C7EB34A|nr:carbohydrate-binding domain-containing protein [Mycobacterium sp. QGD 101]
MLRLRPTLASAAAAAVVAAATVGVDTTPFALAADSTALESEAMSVAPAGGGSSYADTSASGGQALGLWSNSTASATVSLPDSARVLVRAKGQKCRGAPSMRITVDGTTIGSTSVNATSWADYTASANIPAGLHTISVAYTNDYRSLVCDRNLLLDTVTVVASAQATSSPTTTPTTTPPGGSASLGAVIPFAAADVNNPKRGQYENLGVGLFPQSQPAQSSYPAWPKAFDAGGRFEWKDLQPADSRTFNFTPIDNAIAATAAQGKRFHFRVMSFASCCETSYPNNTNVSVPSWLRATAGATKDYVKNGITHVIPNWDSGAYLTAAENLIAALGNRYNKDERVEWFEFSGYSDFSENHNAFMRDTLGIPGPSPSNSVASLGYYSQYQDQYITKASIARLVNATLRAFPDTQILTTAQNAEIVKQAMRDSPELSGLARPVGVRADCLGVYEPAQTWAVNQWSYYVQNNDPIIPVLLSRWRTAPVVTEWCNFAPNGNQALFDKAVKDTVNYHVSLLSSTVPTYEGSTTMPADIYALWAKANKFGGYRYAMTAATLPASATAGSAVPLSVRWTNFGSAPSYDKWKVTYEIRDVAGTVRQAVESSLSLRELAANQNYTATSQEPAPQSVDDSVTLPTAGLTAGTYSVAAKVMWDEHKPAGTNAVSMAPMNLAQEGRDASGGYPIGVIEIG